MKSEYLDILKKRRSIYALGKNVDAEPETIADAIKEAVKLSPTAFNSQTVRVVTLFNEYSNKVWDITENILHDVVNNEDAFKNTKAKIDSFRAGIGTILLFTDTDKVAELEKDFPLYADNFKDWSEQGIGGAQQSIWTVLAEQNIGASLQHYNPLIDEKIAQEFDIPANWKLRAEMPFGSIEAQPENDREFIDENEQFRIIK